MLCFKDYYCDTLYPILFIIKLQYARSLYGSILKVTDLFIDNWALTDSFKHFNSVPKDFYDGKTSVRD